MTISTTRDEHPALEAIRLKNQGLSPELRRRKYERIGQDAFAFFRGTDHLFASAWPDLKPADPGPAILICGDLHLENFGAYRAEDGDFVFDVNDFDEAIVGPCSIDLVRCSTSVLLAAEVWGLSPIQAMRTVLGYLDALPGDGRRGRRRGRSGRSRSARIRADRGAARRVRAGDPGRAARSPDPGRQVGRPVDPAVRRASSRRSARRPAEAVAEAVEAYGRATGRAEAYRVLDVSARIAGIGSLGLRRFVALIEGDGSPDGNRLLDIKEVGAVRRSGAGRGAAARRLDRRRPAGRGRPAAAPGQADGRPRRDRDRRATPSGSAS